MLNNSKETSIESGKQGAFSAGSAKTTEELQWVKYKNEKSGHGFSAEDSNALNDKFRGKKVEKTGLSNEKNGADRVVTDRKGNTLHIQTKYYNSAENTVNSAFDEQTGIYRYKNQVLEVPKDQYEEAIEKMAQKIKEGKVPGITDPEDAKNLIKRGDATYQQARNIAKAGNIDSLLFDIKVQSVTAVSVFGISFVIQYASCIWGGMDKKDALKLSVRSGLKSGGIVLGVGVLTQQFLRTTAGRGFAAFTSSISKRVIDQLYQTEIGKKIIHKLATAILGKHLAGAAAKSAVTKLLRTNLLTAVITTTVMTIPDFWKALVSKKISWEQFGKNFGINVAAVAAGTAGAWGGAVGGTAAGAAIGGAIGSIIPGAGTAVGAALGAKIGAWVGGALGGIGAGVGTAMGAKKLFDLIREDDAKIMFEIAQKSIVQLASDYMITENEFENDISEEISKIITPKWLENMYQAGGTYSVPEEQQFQFAYSQLEPIFERTISKREIVNIPSDKIFRRTYLILFIEYVKNKLRILFKKNDILLDNNGA